MLDVLLKKFRSYNRYRAWSDGSLWLSLDRFERFWPDAGLVLLNGEAVKAAVRAAQRARFAMAAAHRAKYATDADALADYDFRHFDKDYRHRIFNLPRACIVNIVETAGIQDAECVVRWMVAPVFKAFMESISYKSWSAMLYHLSKEDPDTLASRYGIPDDTARKIVEIAGRYKREAEEIRERTAAADQEPLSGWDAVAYAEYRQGNPNASPLVAIRLYLMCTRFFQAWEEIVRCRGWDDNNALTRWSLAFRIEHGYQIPEYEAIIPEDVRRTW